MDCATRSIRDYGGSCAEEHGARREACSVSEPRSALLATFGTPEGGWAERTFSFPSALACDSAGNVLVADTGNHRIVKLDPAGAVLWTVGGCEKGGQPRAGTAQAEFNSPQAICTDPDDNV